MLTAAIQLALAMLVAALVLNLWRLLRGPSVLDRVVALDTMYINVVALLVLLGVLRESTLYFESALVIALVGFVGTVALCKFMLRGNIIE
jgi:multicomponent K+:H+ antiporter subunit F